MNDEQFCQSFLLRYQLLEDDREKVVSIFQQYLLYKGIRTRHKNAGIIP